MRKRVRIENKQLRKNLLGSLAKFRENKLVVKTDKL